MVKVDVCLSMFSLVLAPGSRSMNLDEVEYRHLESVLVSVARPEAERTEITEVKLGSDLAVESVGVVDADFLHSHLKQHVHVGCKDVHLL